MDKRKLTDNEINSILNNISANKSLPNDTYIGATKKIRNDLRQQLLDVKIYPEMIPELKNNILKQYNKTLVSPGESVGVIMAQSIGESQTQQTLNSFHSAGITIEAVVSGVPRFAELLNATKEPKAIISRIVFKKYNNDIVELRKAINHTIVELTFKDILEYYTIEKDKEDEKWYKNYELIYGNDFRKYSYCISCQIKRDKLYKNYLSLSDISQKIENEYEDLLAIFSPIENGKIDIYVETDNINLEEEEILFINQENCHKMYLENVVIPNLNNLSICGIPKIQQMFFVRNKDTWIVNTLGSNLPRMVAHPLIDENQVISNNVWDIYELFGIEAARQFLINEFTEVVSSGDSVNQRHIMLLADIMTHTGTIISISRYGMRKEKIGPLAKASFEESLDNFIKASVYGEVENTNGVSASVMCGKKSKIGTGLFDLKFKI